MRPDVERAGRILTELGAKKVVPLSVSGAFHSTLMKSAAERFAEALSSVPFARAKVPVVQNSTSEPAQEPGDIMAGLVPQMTGPVLWQDSVVEMVNRGVDLFVEVGPGTVLKGLIKRTVPETPVYAVDDDRDREAARRAGRAGHMSEEETMSEDAARGGSRACRARHGGVARDRPRDRARAREPTARPWRSTTQNAEPAQELAAEIEGAGGRAVALAGDVSDAGTAADLVAPTTGAFERLDMLVNNAGVNRDALSIRMSDEDWEAVLAMDLSGAFRAREAAKVMVRQRRGRDRERRVEWSGSSATPGRRTTRLPRPGSWGSRRVWPRAREPVDPGQCRRSGLHRDGDDAGARRRRPRQGSRADPLGPVRRRPTR